MKLLFGFLCCFLSVACAPNKGNDQNNTLANMEIPAPALEKISDDVWVHKSWHFIEPWGPIISQGLVIDTNGALVLVDTAWNDKDTKTLLKLIEAEFGKRPDAVIVTHAHDDKMGGMNTVHSASIPTYAHAYTNEDAPKRGLTPAQHTLFEAGAQNLVVFTVSDGAQETPLSNIEILYPGPGHTRDNIVVYVASSNILFGGCLTRPGFATSMGNTADGDIAHWDDAARNVAAAFPDATIVVPSHGPAGGREILARTIQLAKKAASPSDE